MIPDKKSKKWFLVFIIYTILIFAALMVTRILISSDYLGDSISGMFLLSLCSSLLPCIGGYFGRRIFFAIYTLGVVVGIAYAFYVAIGDIAPGWGTLTSIIGYLFIVVIGIVVALIAETLYILLKSRVNK